MIVCASLVDKVPNLAGLARTCEIFAAAKLLVPSLKAVNDPMFQRISVTAWKWVDVEEVPEAGVLAHLIGLKRQGYAVIGLEQTSNSQSLARFTFPDKVVIVLGKEKEGVPPHLLRILDHTIEIPQLGLVRSLNDSSTTLGPPANAFVSPMLTDLYQITMTYAYWKNRRHNENAVFDLFFRKNPFGGEFTVLGGVEEALRFTSTFKFTESDIAYLRTVLTTAEDEFFEYLAKLDCSQMTIYAIAEGTVVFPREPVLRVEGPLAVGQLMETTLLNLLNYSSLIATNAARFRIAAGPDKVLLEFGLRRAQGPDGGVTASRYSYIGGFNGTSNVLAGKLFGIPIRGTHAHAYVQTFVGLDDIQGREVGGKDLLELTLKYRAELGYTNTNEGELAAFVAYAVAFPDTFLALVDTYNTLQSGVRNYICVALALEDCGHKPFGIRLDSGDLSYLSVQARKMCVEVGKRLGRESLGKAVIVASNDINEEVLLSLAEQGNEINAYGIGTHLVTCQAQPALGMVYKLMQVSGQARIKLSEDPQKVTIPGRKQLFRITGSNGMALLDMMMQEGEDTPAVGRPILAQHPFVEQKRARVTPTSVEPLLLKLWDGPAGGLVAPLPSLNEIKARVEAQLGLIRPDTLRKLNPTPYKVSVSSQLFGFTRDLWSREAPIAELN